MAQFDTLWSTGRTGCIDDGRKIVTLDSMRTFIELSVGYAFAESLNGVERINRNNIDVSQLRAFLPDGLDFVTLTVIFGESHAHMRIVENHAYLCRRVGLVYRNGDCANGHDGQIKGSPLP